MFFWSRNKKAEDAKKEAKIQSVRKDTLKKIDTASDQLKLVNDLLDKDVTLRIFYATGGDKRHGK